MKLNSKSDDNKKYNLNNINNNEISNKEQLI